MEPRGAGGATQEGAARAGGERHGGLLVGFRLWWGGGARSRSRRRGDQGETEREKQQEERSGVVVVTGQRAAQIRGGFEHFCVGLAPTWAAHIPACRVLLATRSLRRPGSDLYKKKIACYVFNLTVAYIIFCLYKLRL